MRSATFFGLLLCIDGMCGCAIGGVSDDDASGLLGDIDGGVVSVAPDDMAPRSEPMAPYVDGGSDEPDVDAAPSPDASLPAQRPDSVLPAPVDATPGDLSAGDASAPLDAQQVAEAGGAAASAVSDASLAAPDTAAAPAAEPPVPVQPEPEAPPPALPEAPPPAQPEAPPAQPEAPPPAQPEAPPPAQPEAPPPPQPDPPAPAEPPPLDPPTPPASTQCTSDAQCTQLCLLVGIFQCCKDDGSCGCSWAPGAYCL